MWTCNVRGLGNAGKRGGVFNFLSLQNCSVVFLQEVHLRTEEDCTRFASEWGGGASFWSVGGVHSSGVGILLGSRDFVVVGKVSFVQGRVLVVDADWGGVKWRFVNVYAPTLPSGRRELFGGLDAILSTNRRLVFGGDFNVSVEGGDFSARALRELIKRFGLVDAFRALNPADPGYTWGNSRGARSRLDFVFVSPGLRVGAAAVKPMYFSDHSGVAVAVNVEGPKFGKGYWHLNVRVLQEEAFQLRVRNLYRAWTKLKPFFPSVLEWWEGWKRSVRDLAQGYCKGKKKRELRRFYDLQRELEGLYVQWNGGGAFDIQRWAVLKEGLKEWSEERARAYSFRCRVEKQERDEKCSAYFFQTVRAALSKKVVGGLRGEDGVIVRGAEDMVGVASRFYGELFRDKGVELGARDRFLGLVEVGVPEGVKAALELPIGAKELREALAGMKGGKVPGVDGLPREFYLQFWDTLGEDFAEVVQEIFRRGELSATMREGVVTLLHKKGDPMDLRNWRPITLLCADYKLVARVLAGRLRLAMPFIVNEDQTCGVEGRSTAYNLQLIRDTLQWVEDRSLPLIVASLDMEKAFDRVNHGVLLGVLARLGFGRAFLKWLGIMYRGVGSRVCLNGHLGEVLKQEGGVRQGCPLSPLLYVLYVEPLAEAIRRDERISGVVIPGGGGVQIKISQYADDATLFLGTERGLEVALAIVEEFGRGAATKLNRAKSQMKYFGAWRARGDALHGLSRAEGPIKILGVEFEGKEREDAERNWGRRVSAAQRKMGLWAGRKLTMSGKVMALKADVLPALNYLARVFVMPPCLRRGLTKAVFGFLWGGYEYVQRVVMYQPVEEGGRDVPCFPLRFDVIFYSNVCAAMAGAIVYKFQFFMRYFVSGSLCFLVRWDNRVPRAEVATGQYRQMLRWAKRHGECQNKELAVSHRGLYKALRDKLQPVGGLGIGVGREVWAKVQPRGLENRLRDLNWLVVFGRLPVRDVLYRHSLTKNRYCPRVGCGGEESVQHVFWGCAFAQEVWGLVEGRYKVLGRVTREKVLWGEGLEKKKGRVGFLALFLLSVGKQKLWVARGERGVLKLGWTARGVLEMVKGEVEHRHRGDVLWWGFDAAKERWKAVL